MSSTVLQDVKCPCGELFESMVYQGVSVQDTPELKDLIMGGEFNVVKCPACHQFIYAERFVLYHDSTDQLMAFVYPEAMKTKEAELKKEMERNFAQIQDELPEDERLPYQPYLLFGMDQLCFILQRDQEVADESDVVEYMCPILKLEGKRVPIGMARKKKMPNVLPLDNKDKDAPGRSRLLEGLKKIVAENDRLAHYRQFLKEVESDPAWKL